MADNETAADQAAPDERPEPHGHSQTVFAVVGPTGSGKTLLSLALGAPWVPRHDDLAMKVRARFSAEQQAQALNMLATTATLRPTADTVVRYELDVDLPPARPTVGDQFRRVAELFQRANAVSLFGSPSNGMPVSARVQVIDGPGEIMFPATPGEPRELYNGPKMRALVESAHALIVCVNAAEPHADVVRSGMSALVSQMTQRGGELPYRAVLVMLTHVDELIDRFRGFWRQRGSVPAVASRYCRGRNASALHPGHRVHAPTLARWLVGDAALHQLWSHLSPAAKFGIGVACAPGFEGSGFRTWTPIGPEDLLYFLLNGEAPRDRRIGAIVEYARDARAMLPAARAREVALEVSA